MAELKTQAEAGYGIWAFMAGLLLKLLTTVEFGLRSARVFMGKRDQLPQIPRGGTLEDIKVPVFAQHAIVASLRAVPAIHDLGDLDGTTPEDEAHGPFLACGNDIGFYFDLHRSSFLTVSDAIYTTNFRQFKRIQ
jgi:hypothetical protein